jgi:fluoride exporter
MVAVMARSLSARRRLAAVLAGGFCGTITRYVLSILVQAWLGKGWPYDLLLINVTGAWLLAFVTTLADATFLVGPTRRVFITVGFLGAYTTFSSFALGDDLLLSSGQWLPALLYLALSLTGGVLAVLLGDWLGLWLISKTRRMAKRSMMTRTLTQQLSAHPQGKRDRTDHLDVQDDLLLSQRSDGQETRQRRS